MSYLLKKELLVYLLDGDDTSANEIESMLQIDPRLEYICVRFKSLDDLSQGLMSVTPDVVLLMLNIAEASGEECILKITSVIDELPIVVLGGKNVSKPESYILYGAQDYIPEDEITTLLLARSIRFAILRGQQRHVQSHTEEQDMLTKLYNRDALMKKLGVMLEAAERYNTGFSMCYIKLDDIDKITTAHGATAGDTLLSLVGHRLLTYSRSSDFVSRYNTHEFITLFPNLVDKSAAVMAAVSQLKVIDDRYLLKGTSGKLVSEHIRARFGLVICLENNVTPEELITSAIQQYDIAVANNVPFVVEGE